MRNYKIFIHYLFDLLRDYLHQPKILKYLINLKVAFNAGAYEGETLEYFLKIKSINKIYSLKYTETTKKICTKSRLC